MAINIRYNDAGAVGSLAQQAGEGQAFSRRFAMGQQLVESARAWQNQQDQLRLQSMQLQNAMRISRTPTGQAAQRQSGPFQQSVQQAKAESQLPSAFTQNLSEGEQHALAIGIKMGDRDMVRQLIQKSLAGQGTGGSATISGTDAAGMHTMQLTPEGVQTFIDPTGQEVQQTVRPEDSPFTPVDIPKPQPSNLEFEKDQPQLTPGQAAVQARFDARQQQRAAEQQREFSLDPIERDLKRLEKKLADDAVSLQPLRDIAEGRKPATLFAALPAEQKEYVQAWAKRRQLLEQGQQQPAPAQGQQAAPADAESQLLEALRALRQ